MDTAFWRRIYNPVDACGATVVTGWAARLYPYLKAPGGGIDVPNPLAMGSDAASNYDDRYHWPPLVDGG